MLIFLAPGVQPSSPPAAGERVIHALEGLIEAAYSKLPEHAQARAQVVDLNRRSLKLSDALREALPEPLHEFWEAYSGWFAMYSLGPLLANAVVGQHALSGRTGTPACPTGEAMIIEGWRRAGWWSGRELLQPALLDELQAAGVRTTVRPSALQPLRPLVARRIAAAQGRAALRRDHQAAAAATAPPSPPQTDVLWLSVGASSADLIARLSEATTKFHGLRSEILDFHYFGSQEGLARHALSFASITGFIDAAGLAAGRAVAGNLPRWWPGIRDAALKLPLLRELPPRMLQAVVERLRLVLLRDAPSWVVQAQAAHRALDAYQPQVVVGTHVYGPPIAPLIIAARRRGIPRLCLQHGVIGPRYLALPSLPYDEQLLFGSYAADILRQTSPPQTRLTVTGHSLYDVAQTPPEPRPEVLRLKTGVTGLAVLCTQFNEAMFYSEDGWWLQGVADACRKLGMRLAIKLHPSETPANVKLYESLTKEDDDRVVLVRHGPWPLSELLVACDMMITRDSTVVFEADLLDRPAITINLSQWDEELPYADGGGALGVYHYEDIEPAIASVLNYSAVQAQLAARRPEFLTAHTGPRDGRATERICAAIAAHTKPSPSRS
ncbi:MAG: hypothetical protein ACYC63_12540 [Armatimonadota bacterium]